MGLLRSIDSLYMWEGFHAKFAVEAASKGIEDLVLLLCTMPDYT